MMLKDSNYIIFFKNNRLLEIFTNTLALTNLIFPIFNLPPQTYEAIRLFASAQYIKVPSWQ
jgi:hypothetical protein